MKLITIEVRTLRNSLVCTLKRYTASLDLVLKEYPPTKYLITLGPEEISSGNR